MARIDLSPDPDTYANPSGNSDQIYGKGGDDRIFGGDQNDDLFGEGGNDYLYDDSVDGPDRLFGGDGDDTLVAGFGDSRDIANGGAGIDLIALDYRGFSQGLRAVIGATMQVRDASNARAITVSDCERLSIITSANADTLSGGAFADTLNGNGGADIIRGGGGGDLITVGAVLSGSFDVQGGEGNDTLVFDIGSDTAGISIDVTTEMQFDGVLIGTASEFEALSVRTGLGDDQISGGMLADSIQTFGGNDTVFGRGGNDRIEISNGNGRAFGGDGRDSMSAFGAEGEDVLLDGGTGNDRIEGYDASETIRGGAGNDTLSGGSLGADLVSGGDGDDDIELFTFSAGGRAFGGAGADKLTVGVHSEVGTVDGGGDIDLLDLGFYGDLANAPVRTAQTAAGYEVRDAGGTLITTMTGFELFSITGTSFGDTLQGGSGADYLTGGRFGFVTTDNDVLFGGGGNDTINGFAATDRVFGGTGNDLIFIGLGTDTVTGGAGRDVYFRQYSSTDNAAANRTRITDFAAGDRIDLSALDANLTDADNDAFTFIGRNTPTEAGQVGYRSAGGITTIVALTNENATADVQVVLTGSFTLTASDFIL